MGTLSGVRNGAGDPRLGTGWVAGPSQRSGTVRETLGEVRDELGVPRGGPGRVGNTPGGLGRVGGPPGRTGTGRVTHPEIRDGSGDAREVRDFLGDPLRGL